MQKEKFNRVNELINASKKQKSLTLI